MSSDNKDISNVVNIQKMVFIYNALLSGWTVKMVEDNKFEFKKKKENKELNLDNYLATFISENLNVDNISKKCFLIK